MHLTLTPDHESAGVWSDCRRVFGLSPSWWYESGLGAWEVSGHFWNTVEVSLSKEVKPQMLRATVRWVVSRRHAGSTERWLMKYWLWLLSPSMTACACMKMVIWYGSSSLGKHEGKDSRAWNLELKPKAKDSRAYFTHLNNLIYIFFWLFHCNW